jgi:hypothetical protein
LPAAATTCFGLTGHETPALHLQMLAYDYPWGACQLPLNCFDASFRSFEHQVLPVLNARGIAAIGMKSMGDDGRPVANKVRPPRSPRFLRHDRGRERDRMRNDDVRVSRERSQIGVVLSHSRGNQLADDDLGPARRIHESPHEVSRVRIDVGMQRRPLDSRLLCDETDP